MIEMLVLVSKDFEIVFINIFKDLEENVDLSEQRDSFIREMEIILKNFRNFIIEK